MPNTHILAAFLAAVPALAAQGQTYWLLTDREADTVWAMRDLDNNGSVSGPAELTRYFGAGNASGLAAPGNITAISVRHDGLIAIADQAAGTVILLRDINRDGDCQDEGESTLAIAPGNPSGVTLTFPSGLTFLTNGDLLVANSALAGPTGGRDAIWRGHDIDGDGRYASAGEITEFVGTPIFGTGNGPYGPQNMWTTTISGHESVLIRNSSTGRYGVYRATDLDADGRADGEGEFGPFFLEPNGAGLTLTTGFCIKPDARRAGAFYILQIGAANADQLIRVRDATGDGEALDSGEARLIWSTVETGFSAMDLLSLADGRLFITDTTGRRVIELRDGNGDDDFNDPGERREIASGGPLGDARHLAVVTICFADYNFDGFVDFFDAEDFLSDFETGDLGADITRDGFTDFFDADAFIEAFERGC
jgi:hypothetical protein